MPISLACNSCGAALRVRDEMAGRKIKCPDCAAVVTVPMKRAGSNKALFIGLGVGCGVLLLLLVVCGGGGIALYLAVKPDLNANVTKENYDRLTTGMGLAEVEAILGPGKVATSEDVREVPELQQPGVAGADMPRWEQSAGRGCVYRWRNRAQGTTIFVAFTNPPGQSGKSDMVLYWVNRNNGYDVDIKGKGFTRSWSHTSGK